MAWLARIVAVLLIINLAILLWPQQKNSSVVSTKSRVDVQQNLIKLAQDAPQLDGQTESPAAVKALTVCYRLGPFLKKENLDVAKKVLENIQVTYRESSREANKATVYRVYQGPFLSKESVLAAKRRLLNKGITDHFLQKKSNRSYIISLGLFSSLDAANRVKEQLSLKIEDVLVRIETMVLPESHWLNVQLDQETTRLNGLLENDWGERSVRLSKSNCSTIEQSL